MAKYNLEGQPLQQIAASLPFIVVNGEENGWRQGYESLVETLLELDAFCAYRVLVCSNGVIRQFVVTSANCREINLVSEALDYLNTLVANSVLRPATSDEHDRLLREFPPIRRNIGRQRFLASNFELPCDFHLMAYTARLLRFALSSGNEVAVQINFGRFRMSKEELRLLRRRVTDLRLSAGLPQRFLHHIDKHMEQLPDCTHTIDEYLGSASTAAMNSVSRMLETAFNRSHVVLGLSGSPVEGRASADEVESGLHSSVFDQTSSYTRVWKAIPADWIRDWLRTPSEEGIAAMGAGNVIKAALGGVDLLAEISRRLEVLDHKTGTAGSGPAEELRRSIRIADTDSLAGIAMARGIVESIVRRVFIELRPSEAKKSNTLDNTIEKLQQLSALPGPVYSSMHLVRKIGNDGAHRTGSTLTRTDLESCMISALRVIEWFLVERSAV